MKFSHSLLFRILIVIAAAFLVTTLTVLYVSQGKLVEIVDQEQQYIYTEKLTTIINILELNNKKLEETGLVEAYREGFQDLALEALKSTYYYINQSPVYPVIINYRGDIVLHPTLPPGDRSLVDQDFIKQVIDQEQGDLEYLYQDGKNKWCIFTTYKPWEWVVLYTVPLDFKYREVAKFRRNIVGILFFIAVLFLLVISLLLYHVIKPIGNLSRASRAIAGGDLELELTSSRRDEIGELTRNFAHMQEAVKVQLKRFEAQNVALKEEITQREKAAQALEQEQERLAVTLRSIQDGVITTDTEGRVVLVNNAAEELLGKSYKEIKGQFLQQILRVETVGEELDSCPLIIKQLIHSKSITMDHLRLRSGNSERIKNIALRGSPIIGSHQERYGAVIVFRDISDRLKIEAERLKAKKLESIGILAGGLAHDFNNIIFGIQGNITLAISALEPQLKIRQYLEAAEEASVRAADLTQQLLTFARGGEPVKRKAMLQKLLLKMVQSELKGSRVRLEHACDEHLWAVNVDIGQFSQVIQHIVHNSIQAMEDGVLSICCANHQQEPDTGDALPAGQYVHIAIGDTGEGIPAENMDKLFDPYFSTRKGGQGLGLAICHSVVNHHGGVITVDSEVGVGTVFHLYLPATRIRTEEAEPLPPHSAGVADKEQVIMVMDDEQMIRDLVSEILKREGYTVYTTEEGREAVQLYQRLFDENKPPGAVIMDLTVPHGMGGKDAAAEITQFHPEAKLIVSSGYSNDPVLAHYRRYGFSAVLSKPYRLEELCRCVEMILQQG